MEKIIDGRKVCYKESGEGECIVILQGWGTHMEVYDSVAATLQNKYRVVQFDFPGFGNSQEPPEAWSVDDYADFFEKLMLELKIEKAILMGHSYGGRVIIKLANRKNLPFVIDRIVLVDSAGILPKKSLKQKLKIRGYKVMKKIANWKWVNNICPELIREWKSRQGSEDYRKASPVMRACLVKAVNEDLTGLLPGIRQETLLIWGELDTATPLEDGKKMEKLIPDAGLAVINGTGHFCFLEAPQIFERILKSYFQIEV